MHLYNIGVGYELPDYMNNVFAAIHSYGYRPRMVSTCTNKPYDGGLEALQKVHPSPCDNLQL